MNLFICDKPFEERKTTHVAIQDPTNWDLTLNIKA